MAVSPPRRPAVGASVTLTVAATAALVAWLAVVAADQPGADVPLPAAALVLAAGLGAVVARRWWGAPRERLRLTRVVQALAITTWVVLLRPGPEQGSGWTPFAETFGVVLLMALVVVLPTTTSSDAVVNRVVVALIATAALLVGRPAAEAIAPLGVATLLACVALAATARTWLDRFPALAPPSAAPDGGGGPPGLGPPGRPPGAPTGRVVRDAVIGGLVVLALVPLLAATEGPQDPGGDVGRGPSRPGAPSSSTGLSLDERLDVGRRGPLGDEVVLRVESAAPDFWRAGSYDVWDGRHWSRAQWRAVDRSRSVAVPPIAPWEVPTIPSTPLEQLVTVEATTTALVGAPRVARVEVPDTTLFAGNDGSITPGRPLVPGTRYRVISQRVPVTPSLLRAHDPLARPLPDELAPYLQLPDVPERVLGLARTVTADSSTVYDSILALEAWMGANTTYTLDIPPLPAGADAVEQHLFVDKRGFCEQIGTSLAVMLRSLGIPARLAVGYVPGDEALVGGEYQVRQRDAHAWVEVWFPGIGWQGFDPTAEVPLAGEFDSSAAGRVGRLVDRVLPTLLALAAGAAAVGLGISAMSHLRHRRRLPWAAQWFQRLERAGRRRGRPRRPAETMVEYARALAAGPLPHPGLDAAAAQVTAVRFAPPTGKGLPVDRSGLDGVLVAACRASRPRWWRRTPGRPGT